MPEAIMIKVRDGQCTVTVPEDTFYRVKVYSRLECYTLEPGRKRFPTGHEHTSEIEAGDTLQIDIYGEGGEGDLMKSKYLFDGEHLVEQNMWNRSGLQVEVREPPENVDITGK